MPSSQLEYVRRINRVLDYVDANLDGDLSLPVLARVACFSIHHFHRIFAAAIGEPPTQFVQRLRLERAATQLSVNPDLSVTEIGLAAGFSNPAAFSRAFRAQRSCSPSEFRRRNSKIGKVEGNTGKASARTMLHDGKRNTHTPWRPDMKHAFPLDVHVRKLDDLQVAYVRHIGPYQGNAALFEGLIGRLIAWAGPRGLMTSDTQMISIYHDNPEVTDPDKLRLSMCITVPAEVKAEGDVGRMTLVAATYAMARAEITSPEQYGQAWEAFYGTWLPKSGYQPADGPALEIYRSDPNDPRCQGKHVVDLCLPVQPL